MHRRKPIIYKHISYGKVIKGHKSEKFKIWFRNVKKWLCIKSRNLYVGNLLLMCPGQDQQQHPAVNTEGVSSGRVGGCGYWSKRPTLSLFQGSLNFA